MQLRELRQRCNLSQSDLAAHLGVRQQTVGNWEAGIRIPRLPMLRKLARTLGVDVGDIDFPSELDHGNSPQAAIG